MNTPANQTPGRPTAPRYRNPADGFGPYYDRINGLGCIGTTEQILEWAARKWGLDQLGYPDLAKAMAVKESWWDQYLVGDGGCSTGILQIRMSDEERAGCNGWPDAAFARVSTAYAADYAMAIVRYHYDGNSSERRARGSIYHTLAVYYCGCQRGGEDYASQVLEYLDSKLWKNPVLFRPGP